MEVVHTADALEHLDFGCRANFDEQVTMQVKRPKLTIWERTYLPQILHGLWLTLKHIPQRKFTRQYPEEKPPLYGAYRGAPTLVKDPDGRSMRPRGLPPKTHRPMDSTASTSR